MSSHTALVRVYFDGEIVKAGEPVAYDGPLDWKYRPNDPAAHAEWESEAADHCRVEEANDGDISLTPDGHARQAILGER